jgi:hypothetical protein
MTMHQRRLTESPASARFVASTPARLLLTSASVVALQALARSRGSKRRYLRDERIDDF